MSTCSRPGCGKTLRRNNGTGHCRTGCLSPEAPEGQRAAGTEDGESPAPRRARGGDAMKRFRTIATALGKDPNALLEEFAEAWVKTLTDRLEDAG